MSALDFRLCYDVATSYKNATWWSGELSALYIKTSNERVIAIPGTKKEIGEWLEDFEAWPIWDSKLGICHKGFRDGAWALWRNSPLSSVDFGGAIVTGHSLGGALAILLGAIMTINNSVPKAIVTFGAPRCGSWKVRSILKSVPIRSYRNGNDPVPDVPWLPGIYVRPRAQIEIGAPQHDPLVCHHIGSYQEAVWNFHSDITD